MKLPLLILVLFAFAISGAFAMADPSDPVVPSDPSDEKIVPGPCRCEHPGVSNAGTEALEKKCFCGLGKVSAQAGQFCCGPRSSVSIDAFSETTGKLSCTGKFDDNKDGCVGVEDPNKMDIVIPATTAEKNPIKTSRFRSAVNLGQKISGDQEDEKGY